MNPHGPRFLGYSRAPSQPGEGAQNVFHHPNVKDFLFVTEPFLIHPSTMSMEVQEQNTGVRNSPMGFCHCPTSETEWVKS